MSKKSESLQKELDEDNIVQSVENLSDLSEEIQTVKERKRKNLSSKTNNSVDKRYRNGVIVPKPDDHSGYDTGQVRDGELHVWVKDKETGELFSQWLEYPNSLNNYSKDNEYVKLCKYLGIKTDNPEEILYENVPIDSSENNVSVHLPEYGTYISTIKHKGTRKFNNIINKVSQSNSLMISINIAIYLLIFRYIVISTPSFIPVNGSEAAALGYGDIVGFTVFLVYGASMFLLLFLNISLTFDHVLPRLKQIYNNIILKINKSLDNEYIE
jgi:hypothetical protein